MKTFLKILHRIEQAKTRDELDEVWEEWYETILMSNELFQAWTAARMRITGFTIIPKDKSKSKVNWKPYQKN